MRAWLRIEETLMSSLFRLESPLILNLLENMLLGKLKEMEIRNLNSSVFLKRDHIFQDEKMVLLSSEL